MTAHMTDLSAFATKRQMASELYTQLKTVRAEIRTLEADMLQHIPNSTEAIPVSANNIPMWLKVQSTKRHMPLTGQELLDKLLVCLHRKFGDVRPEQLRQFAVEITDSIWSERRVKTERHLVLRKTMKKARYPIP